MADIANSSARRKEAAARVPRASLDILKMYLEIVDRGLVPDAVDGWKELR